MDPFIHLLRSSLIQWMIARFNEREKTKQDLSISLGESILRLGGEVRLGVEVRLGEAQLRLGGSKSSKTRSWFYLGKPTFT